MIAFTVIGEPVALPRPKATIRWYGRKAVADIYTPADTDFAQFAQDVEVAAKGAYSGPPLTCSLSLTVTFLFPRPKRLAKSPPVRLPHTTKPDASNLAKGIEDILTGILYTDDKLIAELIARKVYVGANDPPSTIIVLQEIGNVEVSASASGEFQENRSHRDLPGRPAHHNHGGE